MMTTNETSTDEPLFAVEPTGLEEHPFWSVLKKLLQPMASLKLTVVLFAMSIFIVLAGTLAQVEKEIWEVVEQYFRTPFARIDVRVFFPKSFFPDWPSFLPDLREADWAFWFPGGWLIGLGLFANLLVAHLLRFKIQAKDSRLWVGLSVIGIGVVVTVAVVASGSNKDGIQESIWAAHWSTLWYLIKAGLAALWLGMASSILMIESNRKTERRLRMAVVVLLALGFACIELCSLLYTGDQFKLDPSGMRILWQLIKGLFAGLVLLAGCIMVFKKRAGIVVLHGGVGLMMISELLVGLTAIETQMPIQEGESSNFVRDVREFELAIIDQHHAGQPDENVVVVVPESLFLKKSGERYPVVEAQELPFDIQLIRYMKNSILRVAKSGEENQATVGVGLTSLAESVKATTGTDTGGEVDIPSTYVKLTAKGGTQELGTFLFSPWLKDQQVTVEEKTYAVSLRFKRTYKSYWIHLKDVRKDDYLGTDTPRNYSSEVRLIDPSRGVDETQTIWMNNPLRYAGETFYQSGYNRDPSSGRETTTLQVVTNTGWMIPYVSCMIVAVGMLAHFWVVLLRFLNRRAAQAGYLDPAGPTGGSIERNDTRGRKVHRIPASATGSGGVLSWLLSVVFVTVCAAFIIGKARVPKVDTDELDLYQFGKVPVIYQGRTKPIDTLARNSLLVVSGRQTFVDDDGNRQPAIRWLLDLVAKQEEAFKHKVFRIENPEVRDTLGLNKRKGFCYSIEEIGKNLKELTKQAESARKLDAEKLTTRQRKILELERKIGVLDLLLQSFSRPRLRQAHAKDDLMFAWQQQQTLARRGPPLVVPPDLSGDDSDESVSSDGTWMTYSGAYTRDLINQFSSQDRNRALEFLDEILVAYAADDVKTFNRQVARYQKSLRQKVPAMLNLSKTNFEAFFNHFGPFFWSAWLYVLAFVFAAGAWLGWNRPLNNCSFSLIAFTFTVHTVALIARIYISGRPPVTNLYSSAVFIGWGCVLLGMVYEIVYRLGVGNIIASVAGFMTLLIAHFLAGDGDTFTVLQAVLDTQFWLATHVVCITLGYATTFVAGLLAVLYILRGVATPTLTKDVGKSLIRMTYGTVCFAIFFSFVGTVLGGLWADDSWGRFWGWDPKENGALIIVIWNALVLHARWGGMVKDRGLAILAVVGNIVTSWSWFGVNELGVGLHSYGFTQGVLQALFWFWISQMVVIVAGCLPPAAWWSLRRQDDVANSGTAG